MSVPLPGGQALDLGAQWICDRQPEITALVRKLGIGVHTTWQSGQKLYGDGKKVRRLDMNYSPLSWLQTINALYLRSTMGQLMRRNAPETNDPLDHQTVTEIFRSSSWIKGTSDTLLNLISADLCIDTREVSVRELLNQVQSMGGVRAIGEAEQYIVSGGASQITEHFAGDVEHTLFLKKQVIAVTQNVSQTDVETKSGTFTGRHVLLAIPPQCLPEIIFSPPFSPQRLRQWERFRRGKVVKTSAVFKEPFWRKRGLSGTIEKCDPTFPLIVDSSPPDGGFGILTALSTAQSAKPAGEMSVSERGERYLGLLHGLLGPDVPPAEMIRSVDWSNEEFSLGGYASRRAPGGWTDTPDLFAAFGSVHFAGTETADQWRSYMEGAITAGRRAAAQIDAVLS